MQSVMSASKQKNSVLKTDHTLRFKQHVARASSHALEAAIELQRLKGLPPSTARQLFTAMVALVMDDASNRVETIYEDDERIGKLSTASWATRIATSSSAKNGLVGIGLAIRTPISIPGGTTFSLRSVALGPRTEQNPYTAELSAIAQALRSLPPQLAYYGGQVEILRIYDAVLELNARGNKVTVIWKSFEDEVIFGLALMAKSAARRSSSLTTTLKKPEFLEAWMDARLESFTASNIAAGWRATGIFPRDRSKALNSRLARQHLRDQPDSSLWRTPEAPEARELAIMSGIDISTPTSSRQINIIAKDLRSMDPAHRSPTFRSFQSKLGKALDEETVKISTLSEGRDQLAAASESQRPQKRQKVREITQEAFVRITDVGKVKEELASSSDT
ncbi:hypothetical protein LZ31DRAFT_633202 [Colletotrichum somersetense]|nr:hypothetical protein LZ31DRAFT_633202 [Colletotrichum somersetense]